MNKAAIKNFAIWARTKLIEDIKYKAGLIGISATGIAQPLPQSTRDLQFFDIGTKDYAQVAGREIAQRDKLILAIREKERMSDYKTAFRYVIEEVAYTWFNRLIAVRFMEVNDYLPSRVRVLSSENPNKTEPDFVTNPFDTDLSFTSEEQDLVLRLKDENRLDELFGMLFIKQCNKLHEILPNLFEETADYTELLLTLSFTDKDGVVYHLVHDIPEDDFNVSVGGQVEIIGWLYQYYNTEQNELVYDGNMSKSRIPKELLPAATTIYTPDWAVRYMVENSLGRLWTESHPNDDLKSNWKYYLEEAEQEPQVQAQLAEIRKEYAALTPEDIKLIDPCMGSGHILVYAFDVLMQIYVANGYLERDAAQSILQNNLYGLDIDDRAAQLAYFAVMMKARQYDRRIFGREITPHVFALQDSPVKGQEFYALLQNKPAAKRLMQSFHEAKEYGSIIEPDVTLQELDALTDELDALEARLDRVDFVEEAEIRTLLATICPMVEQGRVLKQKYDVVVTNPPYLGNSRFSPVLDRYIKDNYPDEKSDLSTVMYRRAIDGFVQSNGYVAFITTTSWMFLSSFEKVRRYNSNKLTILSLVDFGTELFEGKVGHNPIVSWVSQKAMMHYNMTAVRLVDYCYSRRDEKEPEFFNLRNRYITRQAKFAQIPGAPIAYWVSDGFANNYNSPSIGSVAEVITGMTIGDNNLYLRLWHEIIISKASISASSMDTIDMKSAYWIPYSKGGPRRNWYGNYEYVVNWSKKDYFNRSKTTLQHLYLKEAITWPFITSGDFSARLLPKGFLWDVAGSPCFFKDRETEMFALGAMCSKAVNYILKVVNPTINVQAADVARIPLPDCEEMQKKHIINTAEQNVSISKMDWDSFETSWDFQHHPLVSSCDKASLTVAFKKWQSDCESRFQQLKANEEELNRIFIDIYGLQDELTPEVEDKDVTVRRADLSRDIRSLISYAVGCMFGRYSLDVPGLAFAGGTWDSSKYSTFIPDRDNCIPITDEEYFEDDIVGRFVNFIRTVYGAETLEENLDFIAKALGNKGDTSRQVIRNYFLSDFMKDHMKIYQKRPIYWQFDSGKQNGFKALVYMHRWNADTVGNLRVEYLHRMQRVYEKEMERMQETIDNSGNAREVAAARKRKEKLTKQLKEAKDYDAKIAHIALSRIEIDLDDGVKVNYEKIQKGADGESLSILVKI